MLKQRKQAWGTEFHSNSSCASDDCRSIKGSQSHRAKVAMGQVRGAPAASAKELQDTEAGIESSGKKSVWSTLRSGTPQSRTPFAVRHPFYLTSASEDMWGLSRSVCVHLLESCRCCVAVFDGAVLQEQVSTKSTKDALGWSTVPACAVMLAMMTAHRAPVASHRARPASKGRPGHRRS